MKMVDDYETHVSSTNMTVDVAKIILAYISACKLIVPISYTQAQFLNPMMKCSFVELRTSLIKPNPIEYRNLTASSRVRSLVHSGMLGLLATRLVYDSTQVRSRSSSLSIIQRTNNQAGCNHVKYSMHEFQCHYKVCSKTYKKNPFQDLPNVQALEQFDLLDTLENREGFLAEYHAMQKNAMNHNPLSELSSSESNPKWSNHRAKMMTNDWIADYISAFITTCSFKMKLVNDITTTMSQRCIKLVELYRFIMRIDWLLANPNLRSIVKLTAFYQAFLKRLFYMAKEAGVEHSAYAFMRFFPEMMTPELHMQVIPKWEIQSSPEMQIEDDDALFGPMKLACQSFMPVANPPPTPQPPLLCRECSRWGCDGYDCRYDDDYGDSDGDNDDSDGDNGDSDDDNAQG